MFAHLFAHRQILLLVHRHPLQRTFVAHLCANEEDECKTAFRYSVFDSAMVSTDLELFADPAGAVIAAIEEFFHHLGDGATVAKREDTCSF